MLEFSERHYEERSDVVISRHECLLALYYPTFREIATLSLAMTRIGVM